jgi:hypothetical protein
MVGNRRLGLHLAGGALGLVITGALAVLGTDLTLSDRQAMWGSAGVGTAVLLAQLIISLWNPNRNLEANQRRAKQLLTSGNMERLRGETPEKAARHLPRWGFGPVHGLALAGMAFANVLFIAAELVRLACGWPMNPDWTPGVIGPGDESRLYFSERLSSVKGLWDGQPSAWALNAHELGLDGAALPAQTHHDSWAGTIYVKENESSKTVRPWAEVRFPDSPRVAGKQLQVRADLVVVFPAPLGRDRWEDKQQAFTRTTSVRLAARPGAGRLYAYVWHGGGFAGAAWLGLMSLVFAAAAWSLRRKAFPLKVVHDAEDEPDDEDENDRYDEDDRYDRRRRRRRDD